LASLGRFEWDIGIEILRTESRWSVELAPELDSGRDSGNFRNWRVVPNESESYQCRLILDVVGISIGNVSHSFETYPREKFYFILQNKTFHKKTAV
jgi:hypothetical protein